MACWCLNMWTTLCCSTVSNSPCKSTSSSRGYMTVTCMASWRTKALQTSPLSRTSIRARATSKTKLCTSRTKCLINSRRTGLTRRKMLTSSRSTSAPRERSRLSSSRFRLNMARRMRPLSRTSRRTWSKRAPPPCPFSLTSCT